MTSSLDFRLKQRLDRPEPVPSAKKEHHVAFETEPLYREASSAPTTVINYPHRPKIKASDLSKFYGKGNEDVVQWIEKVPAIFEYSGMSDSDLLQQLPLVLQRNDLTWFTQLGKERHALKHCHDWQLTIKNAFYMPNHRANLQRQCLYRTVRVNESFGD
jgi:hypothetical protein